MRPSGGFLKTLIAAVMLALIAGPASAADRTVDLELVLAVDVSLSMDRDEQLLQREGYAAAFRHADVIKAIKLGGWGRIAVTYIEWAGAGLHRVSVSWREISDAGSATSFADEVARLPEVRLYRTSISNAISFSSKLFPDNGYKGLRRVIDVSGDGPNNQGELVTLVRDRVVARGITINGLPLVLKKANPFGYFTLENLDVYYEDCVIGGPSAFIVTVRHAREFAAAIRRKLILEIAGRAPRLYKAQLTQKAARIDCQVGEKQWLRWRGGLDN